MKGRFVMCTKFEINELVKDRLEKSGIELTEQKSQAEVISEVNRSNIAVARYDEKNDKVTIKESLNG